MPLDRSRRIQISIPDEPSLNLVPPPSNLSNCTNIQIGDQIIEITPHNVSTVRQLGQGAYGFVELIRHEPSGVELAVKRISSSKVTDQPRLLRDMEVLIKTRGCPDVVEFYGAIYWEDNLCLFMEIMDCSLDKFYRLAYKMVPDHRNQIAIPEAVLGRIAFSVVKALHFLHRQQIIHRDVKPSNILINRSGSVKICDFGISGYLVNSVAVTYEAGCKPYMAPERLVPKQNGYDIRSDVWSLGLTLFEIATGTFPYAYNDLFRQIKAIYEDPSPVLPTGRYSEDFHYFISKCLEKNHRERPNYVQLLEYQFIITYQSSDISQFVTTVLDSVD